MGRGLRWNKDIYPNKLLHLLVPLYQDEFGAYTKNEALKKYLDYIIGECGKDLVIKSDGCGLALGDDKINPLAYIGNDYDGYEIPTDILQSYCTTGYNKFTDFMKFLKANKCWNEETYNKLRDANKDWMCEIGLLKTKYPKFSFQQLDPNKTSYYATKAECKVAIEKATLELKKQISKEKFDELTNQKFIKKICEIDKKIPLINFDLYY